LGRKGVIRRAPHLDVEAKRAERLRLRDAAAQALRPLRAVLCGKFLVVHAFLASGEDGVTDHGVTPVRIGHRIFLVQLVVKCGCVFARQLAQRTPYSVKEVDVDPAPTQVAGAISMGDECM
jgi:hypothetical protein